MSSKITERSQNFRARQPIQAVDVRVEVVLNHVGSRTYVDVERNWCLEETCIVREELAVAFTQEIPAKANSWLGIADEVVQGQVRITVKAVCLLEVPAETEVD